MDKNVYMINNYKNIAKEFQEEGKFIKALRFFRKAYGMEGGKYDIELLLDMALVYDGLGDIIKAEEKYREILDIDPDEARAYYGLAILYDDRKDYGSAIQYYKRAIQIDEYYDRAYFFLANIYDEIGEKENAILCYKKTIALKPDDFWAHTNLGSIYEEINEHNMAIEMMEKSLELIPNHHIPLFNMGVIYKGLGEIEKAQHYYRLSIKEEPCYPYSFLNLAIIYKEQQDYKRAIDIITKGIMYNEDTSVLYYNRACCYIHGDAFEKALRDIITATQLSPSLVEYVLKDEELDPIKELKAFKLMFHKNS
ncbi:MAG: tetratricopeptide repeat protein [Maledivibacter sp.]|jgi:tetratricopeptide (TPR) repeat protein|nr:tetratricopeptide repeat protein [Maledivibacter sp.]